MKKGIQDAVVRRERELIVADREFRRAERQFDKWMTGLQCVLEQYDLILTRVCTDEIASGAIHDALAEYLQYTRKLVFISRYLNRSFSQTIDGFLHEIEQQDRNLYDGSTPKIRRDFTVRQQELLLETVSDPWSEMNFVANFVVKMVKLFGWDDLIQKFSQCHKNLEEYCKLEQSDLKRIFQEVYSVDTRYGGQIGLDDGYFLHVMVALLDIKKLIGQMASIIDPQKGVFAPEKLDPLGETFQELQKDMQGIVLRPGREHRLTEEEAEAFLSDPKTMNCFFQFFFVYQTYLEKDASGLDETLKRLIFGSEEIASRKIKSYVYETFSSLGRTDDPEYDTWTEICVKQRLLGIMEKELESRGTDIPKDSPLDGGSEFMDCLKGIMENGYEYLNKHRTSDGKLYLDGRTVGAKAFKEVIEGAGGAAKILSLGDVVAKAIMKSAVDYSEALGILDSLEHHLPADSTILEVIPDIRARYCQGAVGMIRSVMGDVSVYGADIAISKLVSSAGPLKLVQTLQEGIGDITGMGDQAKAQLESLTDVYLWGESDQAYESAWKALAKTPKDSPEYQIRLKELNDCFLVGRESIAQQLRDMADGAKGDRAGYYRYCSEVASDMTAQNCANGFMSFEDYMLYYG